MQWEFLTELDDHIASGNGSIRARIYESTRRLITLRKNEPAMAGQTMELVSTGNPHVLGYARLREGHRLVVLANFSQEEQNLSGNILRTTGLGRFFEDSISERTVATSDDVILTPYQIMWLRRV